MSAEMNCCSTETVADEAAVAEAVESETAVAKCRECGVEGRPISRKTVLLMLKPHLLEEALIGTYSFCGAKQCPVVYFEEHGEGKFTIDDLRLRVGVKANSDPLPLCYCFGFDESHLRQEVNEKGHTTIPERISRLIREGLCACESRNPAGVCCLGEIKKAAKRIQPDRKDF